MVRNIRAVRVLLLFFLWWTNNSYCFLNGSEHRKKIIAGSVAMLTGSYVALQAIPKIMAISAWRTLPSQITAKMQPATFQDLQTATKIIGENYWKEFIAGTFFLFSTGYLVKKWLEKPKTLYFENSLVLETKNNIEHLTHVPESPSIRCSDDEKRNSFRRGFLRWAQVKDSNALEPSLQIFLDNITKNIAWGIPPHTLTQQDYGSIMESYYVGRAMYNLSQSNLPSFLTPQAADVFFLQMLTEASETTSEASIIKDNYSYQAAPAFIALTEQDIEGWYQSVCQEIPSAAQENKESIDAYFRKKVEQLILERRIVEELLIWKRVPAQSSEWSELARELHWECLSENVAYEGPPPQDPLLVIGRLSREYVQKKNNDISPQNKEEYTDKVSHFHIFAQESGQRINQYALPKQDILELIKRWIENPVDQTHERKTIRIYLANHVDQYKEFLNNATDFIYYSLKGTEYVLRLDSSFSGGIFRNASEEYNDGGSGGSYLNCLFPAAAKGTEKELEELLVDTKQKADYFKLFAQFFGEKIGQSLGHERRYFIPITDERWLRNQQKKTQ